MKNRVGRVTVNTHIFFFGPIVVGHFLCSTLDDSGYLGWALFVF